MAPTYYPTQYNSTELEVFTNRKLVEDGKRNGINLYSIIEEIQKENLAEDPRREEMIPIDFCDRI